MIFTVLVVLFGFGCAIYFLPNGDAKEDMVVALEDSLEHRFWSSDRQTPEDAANLPSEEVDCLVDLWITTDGRPKAWYNNSRTQVHLQTDLIFQSVLILGSPMGYTLHWGCSRDWYDAYLSREGEAWTVDDYVIDNLDAQIGREEVESILSQARKQALAGRLSAEKRALLERIENAEAICTVSYSTWEAALAAAKTLDLDGLNVFDLE